MGRAFNSAGQVLGEASGATKEEVLGKLTKEFPDAAEVRIRTAQSPDFIDKPFAYHKPSEDGQARIDRLRFAFSVVQREIDACCQLSRQKSIATTELETAAMWAIKAVVFNDPLSVAQMNIPAEPVTT